jgi:hypothetical protein
VILAVIVGVALLALLLIREIELILRPGGEQRVQRLDGPIVGLSVAVGVIVVERVLVILF